MISFKMRELSDSHSGLFQAVKFEVIQRSWQVIRQFEIDLNVISIKVTGHSILVKDGSQG